MSKSSKKAIDKSVYKAADRKQKPSKEKHVRAIILRSFAKDGSVDEIIRALEKRLEKANWAVVVKCLMIFHRCFRDGDPALIEQMKPRSQQTFALRVFTQLAPPNHLYTVFVKKYAKYLEEKVSVLRLLGYQFEKNKDAVKDLKPPKCFKVVPKLQSQLNALLNCKMRAQHIGHSQLIHRTYLLLMKDSLPLYSMLNEAILQLLDQFWKMKKKDASRVLTIYKLFCKETDALIALYEVGKKFVRQLPEITKAETTIIESMERYVESLVDEGDDDEDEDYDSGSNKKKKKDKKKKGSEEESSGAELRDGEDEYDDKDYAGDNNKNDKDSDDEDEESSGEDEEEPNQDPLGLNDFFKAVNSNPVAANNNVNASLGGGASNPFVLGGGFNNNASFFPPPSFGPGSVSVQPAEPTYQQKANLIKSLIAAEPYGSGPSPFGANVGVGVGPSPFGSNVFGATGTAPNNSVVNPFASLGGAPLNGGVSGSTTVSNPFASVANPFTTQNTGASANLSLSLVGSSNPTTNPFGPTLASNTNIFSSNPNPPTQSNPLNQGGIGASTNIFASSPASLGGNVGVGASTNIFGTPNGSSLSANVTLGGSWPQSSQPTQPTNTVFNPFGQTQPANNPAPTNNPFL
eukprot:TRINITY_DN5316_c0_g1_i1.p1 TRINITY_DN5316_c0_g1~~TRINITY_DN5316_c0_g1_i1.p1  ORF type:complete len:638 (+),score=225.42 TRINITY_DN5316_c0_g1_i1:24-1916(+)